ncbi:hypothetical protein ABC977_10460 [Thioalkalicoccus limnaeus]|uniref:Uncharacterized protein n=1 Tax=Thioalkalicoccus limnaeus TaxID=120681 RepID=A0ABV4BFT0_9GAMM
MKLFQSIFGRGETRGHYPESLIETAIERAVDGTDARLRHLPGFRRRLRQPVIHAIDHVVALVDAIPAAIPAARADVSREPRLAALFASADAMLEAFGQDPTLARYLASPEGRGSEAVTTLLLAERIERNILGLDLVGDQVRRDVPQVAVSFTGHRLLEPQVDEAQTRRYLKRRAFDHLLTLALARIAEARVERADLARQRDLLKQKQRTLERSGWTLEPRQDQAADPVALMAELDRISAQLDALGADQDVLQNHLEIVAHLLDTAARQLWAEPLRLWLDAMNIQRDDQNPAARPIDLAELHNARGRRAVMLPLIIRPGELPAREDFVVAAERYLR